MEPKDREFGGATPAALLAARSASAPASPALISGGREYTYRELDERASAVAAGLLKLGLPRESAVAIFLQNSAEYVFALYGIARAGMVQVPINTAYKGTFLRHVLEHSSARVLLTESRLAPALRDLGALPSELGTVVYTDFVPEGATGRTAVLTWEELLASRCDTPFPVVSPADTSAILYTSGTTGRSKGVVLPHFSDVVFGREAAVAMKTGPADRLYTCLPLFHGNARCATFMHALYAGAAVVLSERFSASRFWDEVRSSRATEFNALGPILNILLTQPETSRDRDHDVRRAFVAPAPPDVLYRFEQRFRIHIVEGYGLTETKNIAYNPWGDRKVGSFGKPTASSEIEIQDELGAIVGPGVVGEIVYRPKLSNIMLKAYHRDPEATLAASKDMWWHTGDLGFKDSEGFFYFADRKKDALRRRGENISSYEVEAVLTAHPAVSEAAVVAVKSEMGEDEVLAVLHAETGARLDFTDVFKHCDARMPYFMVPRYYRAVGDLPRTANGKVRKELLRAEGVVDGTWDATAAGLVPTRQV